MKRFILALAAIAAGNLGPSCGSNQSPLGPTPGLLEYRVLGAVAVPGARVDVAGLNLAVRRVDLSIDTRIGTHQVAATYNSATDAWLWSFDIRYDGETFTDYSGAVHDMDGVVAGEAVAGTYWVRLGERTMRTKGGLVHEFSPAGHLAALYWASDPYPRIVTEVASFAGVERVVEVDQCRPTGSCKRVYTIERDAAGRPTAIEDRAERRAEFDWDASDRLVVARDALDRARGWPGFRYEYGASLSALVNSEGERVEFDASGDRLDVRAIGAGDPVWSFVRKPKAGGVYETEFSDPTARTVRYFYDAERRIVRIVNPLGEESEWSWQGRRPVRLQAADGTTVDWVLEGDDVASEAGPGGNVVTYAYAPTAVDRAAPLQTPRLRVEDALGLVEERQYDAEGRIQRVSNGAGESLLFSYNGDGELIRMVRPDGTALEFDRYRDHGHPETLRVDGAAYDRVFDDVGNLLLRAPIEPDLPGVGSRSFDEDRNVASVTVVEQQIIYPGTVVSVDIDRGSDGRILAISRSGPGAAFLYDALGRSVERWEAVAGSWAVTRFEWDAAGRLVGVERPDGAREERVYDGAGRLAWRAFGRGSPLAVESAVSLTWQGGRVQQVVDLDGSSDAYAYDGLGRLASISFSEGGRLGFTWDARSRPVAMQVEHQSSGFTAELQVGYDAVGREVSLGLDGSSLVQRSIAASRVAEINYGSGLVRSFTRDEAGLNQTETFDAGGAPLARAALENTSEPGGPLCMRQQVDFLEGSSWSAAEDWCLGLIQSPLSAMSTIPGDPLVDWAPLSDIRSMGGNSFQYNEDRSRLLEVRDAAAGASVHAYLYDASGNVVERDGETIVWDAAGRVQAVGDEHELSWDGLGQPLEQRTPQGTTRWGFGGMLEVDANGSPLALELGEVRVDLVAGQHRYRHFDSRGNVSFVSDEAGSLRTLYRYDDFGKVEIQGADDDSLRFARGRQVGDLVLLGHRLLDPEAGRFLAPDPVFQLFNQYAYALGNPILFWDPSGLAGTFHGLTAGEWSVALNTAGAFTLAAALALGVPFFGGAAAVAVGAYLGALELAGGLPWEGDRTVGDGLRSIQRDIEGMLRRLPASPTPSPALPGGGGVRFSGLPGGPGHPVGGSPNRGKEGIAGPGIHFSNGASISACAPTQLGRRIAPRWIGLLACVNVALGVAVWRRTRP
jgi:RHS repeat-associated protein